MEVAVYQLSPIPWNDNIACLISFAFHRKSSLERAYKVNIQHMILKIWFDRMLTLYSEHCK